MPPSALPGQRERTLALTFTAVTVACWLIAALGGDVDWSLYVASVALLVVVAALVLVRRYRIAGRELSDLPWALAYLAATGLLRAGSPGESALALIPVVCIALTGSSWVELAGAIVATVAACIVPAVVGVPAVPFSSLRGPLVAIALTVGIGIATRLLVAAVRSQAETAERDRLAVERVGEVVYGLFASRDVRADLCAASLQLGYAEMAVLLEPMSDGEVRVTAQAGVEPDVVGSRLAAVDPLAALLREGRRHLQNEIAPERLGSPQAATMWERCGRPDAILYQPLLRGSEPVGLLCIGWHDEVRLSGPRVTAIGLLTHEAALLLTRADQVTRLTGMATTDPLTALPNRRAWDARIEQAEVQPGTVTVAMIDLDNFKAFNDTYGHLAGDALLRQTADAWTAELRGGDLLARVGGEEFGLLVYDAGLEAAHRVAERMRHAVTHEQTCCVGLAQRRPGEPMESVVARADRALYEAKAAGRDLARAAL